MLQPVAAGGAGLSIDTAHCAGDPKLVSETTSRCLTLLVPVPAGGVGLSIEQRKRLSIGVELVANPSVVFSECGLERESSGME